MKKTILSIEDDDAAFMLLRIAFEHVDQDIDLQRASDGTQGLAFLHRLGTYHNAPRPDMILLNLNMPRLNGFEVMEALRKDESVNDIPVVVFSTSSLDADRARCLALGARQFITKPHDFEALLDAVKIACAHA